jgi:hypothetical protein
MFHRLRVPIESILEPEQISMLLKCCVVPQQHADTKATGRKNWNIATMVKQKDGGWIQWQDLECNDG